MNIYRLLYQSILIERRLTEIKSIGHFKMLKIGFYANLLLNSHAWNQNIGTKVVSAQEEKNDKKEKITRCSAKMTNVHGIQIDGNKHVCLHIYLMRYFNSEKKRGLIHFLLLSKQRSIRIHINKWYNYQKQQQKNWNKSPHIIRNYQMPASNSSFFFFDFGNLQFCLLCAKYHEIVDKDREG